MPWHLSKFPTRDEVIAYLEDYARAFDLKVHLDTPVREVRPDGGAWRVAHGRGETEARAVVFATGLNGTPHRGTVEGLESFPGPVLHSHDYVSPKRFAGQTVIVVDFGNSGGDIALELAKAGARPVLSVRGPVNIVPFSLFGVPTTSLGGLRKILPYRLVDALTAPVLRAKIGRPEDYGLVSSGKGPAAQVIEDGRVPLIDHGTLAAIKTGRIDVRRGITRVDGNTVRFVNGTEAEADAIILATGYRVDLRDMLPESQEALDDQGRPHVSGAPGSMPGLYFCSYRASADGQLRQTASEAEAIAKDIATRLQVLSRI